MKTYNKIITITFILALYVWVYDGYLYERTYVRYLPNYKEEVAFPTYPIDDSKKANGNVASDDLFKNTSVIGKIMYIFFPIAFILVHLLFVISFVMGCICIFKNRKQLSYKWYIVQLILYSGIVYFVLNTPIMD